MACLGPHRLAHQAYEGTPWLMHGGQRQGAGGWEAGGILEAHHTLRRAAFFCTGVRVTGSTQGETAMRAASTIWGAGMDIDPEGGCGSLKTSHMGDARRPGEGGWTSIRVTSAGRGGRELEGRGEQRGPWQTISQNSNGNSSPASSASQRNSHNYLCPVPWG